MPYMAIKNNSFFLFVQSESDNFFIHSELYFEGFLFDSPITAPTATIVTPPIPNIILLIFFINITPAIEYYLQLKNSFADQLILLQLIPQRSRGCIFQLM